MNQEERDQLERPKYQLNGVLNFQAAVNCQLQGVAVIMNAENILILCDFYVCVKLRNLQLSKAR